MRESGSIWAATGIAITSFFRVASGDTHTRWSLADAFPSRIPNRGIFRKCFYRRGINEYLPGPVKKSPRKTAHNSSACDAADHPAPGASGGRLRWDITATNIVNARRSVAGQIGRAHV